MRARLEKQAPGEGFRFLCDHKMAKRMPRVISAAGGEILDQDLRSYGVVILVHKKN